MKKHPANTRVRQFTRNIICFVLLAFAILMAFAAVRAQQIPLITFIPNGVFYPNPGGASQTYSTTGGGIDLTGPFFQSLGTNGRSCGSCHAPEDGWTVIPAHIQQRFNATGGTDPIFRSNASNIYGPAYGNNCLNNPFPAGTCFAAVDFDLGDQANGATRGHAQAA